MEWPDRHVPGDDRNSGSKRYTKTQMSREIVQLERADR